MVTCQIRSVTLTSNNTKVDLTSDYVTFKSTNENGPDKIVTAVWIQENLRENTEVY